MSQSEWENSELPPSRRDRSNLESVVRQQGVMLRSGSQGLSQGRFVPARPLPPTNADMLADDDPAVDGIPDDSVIPTWQWEDRFIATGGGIQTATLTYIPIDESLFVRWHPNGLGGLPITNEHFTVEDNVVTVFPPAGGVLQAGDQFSFQYQYLPNEILGQPDFIPVTFVGATLYNGTPAGSTPLGLPVGTQAGDTLVLGNCSWSARSISDSRFAPAVANFPGQFVDMGNVWVGTEDGSGSAVTMLGGSLHDATVLAVFRGSVYSNVATDHDNTIPVATTGSNPQIASTRVAVAVAMSRTGITPGGITHNPGSFTTVAAANDSAQVNIDLSWWSHGPGDPGTSPSDSFAFGGSVEAWGIATLKMEG